jgi:hypothetical protein
MRTARCRCKRFSGQAGSQTHVDHAHMAVAPSLHNLTEPSNISNDVWRKSKHVRACLYAVSSSVDQDRCAASLLHFGLPMMWLRQ